MNSDKTEKGFFISSFNCSCETAYDEMMRTQTVWGKRGKAKILGYHVMQSFKPGEITPELAHEVGCELVRRCLAKKYEVVVTTHLNRNHLHNHVLFNSVSFVDGIMYRNNFADYYRDIRAISDDLCRKYGLSVIIDPARSGKHYAQWKAEQEGKPTWHGLIKTDVDKAIAESITFSAFLAHLKSQGYEIKTGVKHLAVRPPGKTRFVRLRSLGDNYTEEAIKKQILRQIVPKRQPKLPESVVRRVKFKGDFTLHRITFNSIRALYFYYLYKLRQAQRQPEGQVHFLLREELRNLDTISNQAKFLNRHKLDTSEQVATHKVQVEQILSAFYLEKKELINEKRRMGIPEIRKTEIQTRINELSKEISQLGREVQLCEDILVRSITLDEKRELMKHKELIHEKQNKAKKNDRSACIK